MELKENHFPRFAMITASGYKSFDVNFFEIPFIGENDRFLRFVDIYETNWSINIDLIDTMQIITREVGEARKEYEKKHQLDSFKN